MYVNTGQCQNTNFCDFESIDLCGYKNDNNADFNWVREQGVGENFDHTYESNFGHYMKVVSPTNSPVGRSARLISQQYPATTLCTQFWYKTNGNLQFSLKTFSFGVLSANTYFKFMGINGNQWALAQATINNPFAFQLAFEALVNNLNTNGYILLDDIKINYKSCTQPASCNFEDDFCGFTSLRDADFEWIILNGQFGINHFTNNLAFEHKF